MGCAGQNTRSRVDGQRHPHELLEVGRGKDRPEVRLRRKVCGTRTNQDVEPRDQEPSQDTRDSSTQCQWGQGRREGGTDVTT